MKTLNVLLILMFALSTSGTFAAPMDDDTQQLLVDKLERVMKTLDEKSPAWTTTRQRLADLLSERARQRFIGEVEANCKDCKGSAADRKRAISLYKEILNSGRAENPGAVILQLAHLKMMAGETTDAKKDFETLANAPKGKYEASWVLDARLSLADIYFQEGANKKAMAMYEIVSADKNLDAKERPLVMYRLAWCQFNDGKLKEATEGLERLATSDLIAKDESLRSDALHDLATFYSRRPITKKEIDHYYAIAPAGERKEYLLYFAGEADRIGQKSAADTILALSLKDSELSSKERLDVFIRRAQIKYDMGQSANSTDDFAVAAVNLKEIGCKDAESCADVQKRMKHYVTELHRSQRHKPSIDVLKAYYIYSQSFPQDVKMTLLGAQVAVELKKLPMAAIMYRQAADFATDESLQKTAVMGEIKVAELSKDPAARETAYLHALKVRPRDGESFKIRYQLAHLPYEKKQWSAAASAFRELALDKAGDPDLRKKSADLALDSLALEKRDQDLQVWAAEFAAALPNAAQEYNGMSRKAVINEAAKEINADDSSSSNLKNALRKLQATNLKDVPDAEKILILKNRAAIAQKLDDQAELAVALTNLLIIKSLSAKDREDALARLVGRYEDRFEFAAAYRTARKMSFPSLTAAEKERRLGTLADLAGQDPRAHYKAALRKGLKGWAEQGLRLRLVQLSANPAAELRLQRKALKASPAVLGEAVLWVYSRTRNAKDVAADLKTVPANVAKFINKQPQLIALQKVARALAAHRLTASPDSALRRSIDARRKLLANADRSLTDALKLKDFTSQVLALDTVARENDRFVQDLLSLPMPKGLKANEQARYTALLKQTSAPFAAKARLAQAKVDEMWARARDVEALLADLDKARAEMRPFLMNEARLLAAIAPSRSLRSQLDSAAREPLPAMQDLASALDSARANPRSVRDLQKLKTMEAKIGHPLMPAYIDGRVSRLTSKEI